MNWVEWPETNQVEIILFKYISYKNLKAIWLLKYLHSLEIIIRYKDISSNQNLSEANFDIIIYVLKLLFKWNAYYETLCTKHEIKLHCHVVSYSCTNKIFGYKKCKVFMSVVKKTSKCFKDNYQKGVHMWNVSPSLSNVNNEIL